MSKVPSMSLKDRAGWVAVQSWRISGELIKLNPIDRMALLEGLCVEMRIDLARREKQDAAR